MQHGYPWKCLLRRYTCQNSRLQVENFDLTFLMPRKFELFQPQLTQFQKLYILNQCKNRKVQCKWCYFLQFGTSSVILGKSSDISGKHQIWWGHHPKLEYSKDKNPLLLTQKKKQLVALGEVSAYRKYLSKNVLVSLV